jgi:translation elongation factor EF-4
LRAVGGNRPRLGQRLKDPIPRQLFAVAIQTAIGGRIIAEV